MNIYSRKQKWKLFLLSVAVIIGLLTFFVTYNLTHKLTLEERKKVELWAKGMKHLSSQEVNNDDYTFALEVIQTNETVPVILTDKNENIITSINLDEDKTGNDDYMQRQLRKMKSENPPIVVYLLKGDKNYIFYRDSTLLTQLMFFPVIQLAVITLFLVLAYWAFSASRKAEQNNVWVGMSKETAHQLGTPTSSLMANLELLRLNHVDESIVNEIEKDVERLEMITERFSKIGSTPVMRKENIIEVVTDALLYVKARSSRKVEFITNFHKVEVVMLPLNAPLFSWVLENVCKNAIDSMGGVGRLTVTLDDRIQYVFIDVKDEGKGISKSHQRTIFQPGFTTKKRGWGLGLTLSKRIVEEYHKGRIFVVKSIPEEGTTMRIVLKK
ncbi:MAG: HAMP domain-containing sensor histidine kinase [Bacteroidales bacterium]